MTNADMITPNADNDTRLKELEFHDQNNHDRLWLCLDVAVHRLLAATDRTKIGGAFDGATLGMPVRAQLETAQPAIVSHRSDARKFSVYTLLTLMATKSRWS